MKNQIIAATFLVAAFSKPLFAQTWDSPIMLPNDAGHALVKNARIIVDNQTSGECWTNSAVIESRARLSFEQSGIFVPDYEIAFTTFASVLAVASAYGFRGPDGLCVVSASFNVFYEDYKTVSGGGDDEEWFSFRTLGVIHDKPYLLTNPSNANSQLAEFFETEANIFLAKAISSRRNEDVAQYLNSPNGSSNSRPMSTQEWDDLFNID